MSLYKTLSEARMATDTPMCSWQHRTIFHVVLDDGREFYRSTVFDQYHKCKRCRNADRRDRIASAHAVGNTHCPSCGNPYYSFVRQGVRRVGDTYETLHHCWSSSGRLH